jgi:hypothetical protein
MKKEEQRMEKEMESIMYGEERMKYKIKLMKYRENRMEYEIELMKRRENSVDQVTLVQTPICNQELSMSNEIERMKTREKHMTCEIERMEHYETRLIDEIRSIENEIKYKQYFPTSNYHSNQKINKYNNYTTNLEEISQELEKHQRKLSEHSKEILKRKIKLEKSYMNRIEYEVNLYSIRKKIEQDRQYGQDVIKNHDNYYIQLLDCRAKRLKLEVDILQNDTESVNGELQLMENDEKLSKFVLLSMKLDQSYTLCLAKQ